MNGMDAQPRFQSLYQVLVWVSADGVVEVDWADSYQYSHDRVEGKDYNYYDDTAKRPGADVEAHSEALNRAVGDWGDVSRHGQAQRLRRLADHLDATVVSGGHVMTPAPNHG